MKRIIFILFLMFFTSCSVNSVISQDKLYDNALKYTKRGEIHNSLETKALIDAVYLNPLYPNELNQTTFLIGVYNDFDNSIDNEEFNLTLNNQKPLKIDTNIPKFVLYKEFPFYNSWMKYYLVEFNVSERPFILEYKSKDWGETKLRF